MEDDQIPDELLLTKSKKFSGSIKKIDKSSNFNSNLTDSLVKKCIDLKDINNFEEVIKSFDDEIEINPNNYLVYYNIANFLNEIGNSELAIHLYDKAIQLNPKYSEAFFKKGLSLKNTKKY
jgi:tetratricopeptide (TPR) repeat protein